MDGHHNEFDSERSQRPEPEIHPTCGRSGDAPHTFAEKSPGKRSGEAFMPILEGKVVAITGAGRGIGRAIALLCASEGARVVVNDFGVNQSGADTDAAPATVVAREIADAGGHAVANTASVADPEGAASIVEHALSAYGRIDAVVNNAGFLRDNIFHKMSLQEWDDVLRVHLHGSYYVARAAAPHFRTQNGGAFVNLTSTTGLLGNVGQANYAAAKAGIVGLSTSIALDMARFGVRSNCIAPTAWTRLIDTVELDTEQKRARAEKIKALKPEHIAPLAAFLCSEAAREVSGQVFGVRGNEVFLYARPTIVRTMHRAQGWTPRDCAETLMPAFKPSFHPLARTDEIITWDPL